VLGAKGGREADENGLDKVEFKLGKVNLNWDISREGEPLLTLILRTCLYGLFWRHLYSGKASRSS
jgi:hypothetical protein